MIGLGFFYFVLVVLPLNGKPYFLFPDVQKRWSFKENCPGIWSFLYYWERWYFFFPKIWSYSFDRKWKTIFLEKNTWKYYIFFKYSEKIVFSKQLHRNMIFLVLSGKMVFFPRKHDIFSLDGKWKMIFLKKYMIFSVHTYRCNKQDNMPLCQKNSKMIFSCKNTLKGDWHSRLTF